MSRDCLARQYSDQMNCPACGLAWDMNDPEPPRCGKVDRRTRLARAVITTPVPQPAVALPERLPADVARAMEVAWLAQGTMQAAYRVLLDWMGS